MQAMHNSFLPESTAGEGREKVTLSVEPDKHYLSQVFQVNISDKLYR